MLSVASKGVSVSPADEAQFHELGGHISWTRAHGSRAPYLREEACGECAATGFLADLSPGWGGDSAVALGRGGR